MLHSQFEDSEILQLSSLFIECLPNDPAICLGIDFVRLRLIPFIISECDLVTIYENNQIVAAVVGSKPAVKFSSTLTAAEVTKILVKNRNLVEVMKAGLFELIYNRKISGYKIDWILVKPTFQGKGLGRDLIIKILNQESVLELKSCSVRTLKKTPRNLEFYAKNGFVIETSKLGRVILSRKLTRNQEGSDVFN
jgi:GNAT superfamily N-acetyltransferase